MKSGADGRDSRRGTRTKAVFPVRVKGKDSAGRSFEELAHTLDVTPSGARLGAIHHELALLDEITVFYRQRKMLFRVVWTKKLKGTSEFQVGLKAVTQEREAWGVSLSDRNHLSTAESAVSQASGAV
jgi:Flp pilus assembly pilin Flp